MFNLLIIIWAVFVLGFIGMLIGSVINAHFEQKSRDAYSKPRAQADKERQERDRMETFLRGGSLGR